MHFWAFYWFFGKLKLIHVYLYAEMLPSFKLEYDLRGKCAIQNCEFPFWVAILWNSRKKKKEADISHVKMYCIQKIQKKNNANAYLFIISRILCLINFKRYPRRLKWKPFEHTQIPLSPFDIGMSSSLLSVFAIVLKQGTLSNSHFSFQFVSELFVCWRHIRRDLSLSMPVPYQRYENTAIEMSIELLHLQMEINSESNAK